MNIKEFAERVIELSPQIAKGFLQDAPTYLTKSEITVPQFITLDYLARCGRSTMNNLAKHLMISPPAMTGLIDRLITQGLVTRGNDDGDRRIIWIELSAKGRQAIAAIKKHKIQNLVKVFSQISANDRIRYLDVLEQIVKINSSTADDKKNAKIS
jgi:DNA-binding MarR family transcriptional regulator